MTAGDAVLIELPHAPAKPGVLVGPAYRLGGTDYCRVRVTDRYFTRSVVLTVPQAAVKSSING